jgi:hypothetical protein
MASAAAVACDATPVNILPTAPNLLFIRPAAASIPELPPFAMPDNSDMPLSIIPDRPFRPLSTAVDVLGDAEVLARSASAIFLASSDDSPGVSTMYIFFQKV